MMRGVRFYKYHGAGNDFLVVDEISDGVRIAFEELIDLAPKFCSRHTGIGADGILVLDHLSGLPRMRVINSDGSCAQMCGNGSRCIARHLFERHDARTPEIQLVTGRGTLSIQMHAQLDTFINATVDMGAPIFEASRIPVKTEPATDPLRIPMPVEWTAIAIPHVHDSAFSAVSMGNPHAVFVVDDITRVDIKRIGPVLESASIFPEKANIHFAQVIDRSQARIVTWERGAGATLACGTGACASLVALHSIGLVDRTADIHVPGGTLRIHWRQSDSHVLMTGPAEFVAIVEG